MAKPDPMLHLLEWLCAQLVEAEANGKFSACKNERTKERPGCRSGCRVRKWDTRMGTIYLLIPRLRGRGCIPFFLAARKRSEGAPVQVVQEAYIQGVSARKMEKPVQSPGIDLMSGSYVSELTKGLNDRLKNSVHVHFREMNIP